MDYPGKVITKNAVIPTQTSAPGVWTLDDAAQAQKANSWPIPGVPNPISKSLRFNSADSAYLDRTPSIESNRRTWTWSGWAKRGTLGATRNLFEGRFNSTNITALNFNSTDTLLLQDYSGSGYNLVWETSAVFRDPSAWYHIVFVYDTTQASSANAVKLYVNGVQQTLTLTAYGGSYTQNRQGIINFIAVHSLGRYNTANFLNGYMTEINFVDGQALTPSDFGMTDTVTGVWVPKKYTGTYGTNGFYLNFKDSTNTTTLGYDYSGNGNNWNANNFSVTAGAGNDSLTDVPTQWVGYSATNIEAGGVIRGNYCTFNPLKSKPTLSNGNLDAAFPTTTWYTATSTFAVSSGKWYWEVTWGGVNNSTTYGMTGIVPITFDETIGNYPGYDVASFGYFSIGQKYNNGTPAVYGASYTNDTIGVALDMDAGTIVFYKNGVSQGTAYTGLAPATFTPAIATYGNNATINFGQRPFAYTPPSGYKSLCTTNLPTPTIVQGDDYFNAVLYTGNGTSQSVTGVGFQPDFVWMKDRTNAYGNVLYDVVRGTGTSKALYTNLTDAENAYPSLQNLTSFDSNGFTVGSTSGTNIINTGNLVAWNWKANGAGSSNTAGTISSTVSVNTTSGFSIVTYTGNGIAGATIGHGLGAAPSMIIVKKRTGGAQTNWPVYHKDLGNTKYLDLNSSSNASTDLTRWNNTSPTSTVFTAGDAGSVNGSGFVYVAYCFAPIEGYSAFGSYTGNGSTDGPFVYLGFRPKFLMVKSSSINTENWQIVDTSRDPYNVSSKALFPNLSNAEVNASSVNRDILSNGFKIRSLDTNQNGSGGTYIYAAFAENPFKFANAR